jgi:Flp pilus assembly secretin CpaC
MAEDSGVLMRIARLWACVLGLTLLTMLPIARASNDVVNLAPGGGSQLTLERPFYTVMIGNPDVVEVELRNDRMVVLKALSVGASNVVFLDEQSVVIANIKVVVSDART